MKLIKPSEAARLLNCSRQKIYRLVDVGELKALQLGGPGCGLRIDKNSVDSFIKRQIQVFQFERGIPGDLE